MKQNKTLFNQIFEKFQTLNEADEQLSTGDSPVSNDKTPDQSSQNSSNENVDKAKIDEIAKTQLQLLQDKFKNDENKKEIIDKIIKKALGEGDGDEKEAKELIDRIKKSLSE